MLKFDAAIRRAQTGGGAGGAWERRGCEAKCERGVRLSARQRLTYRRCRTRSHKLSVERECTITISLNDQAARGTGSHQADDTRRMRGDRRASTRLTVLTGMAGTALTWYQ